MDKDGLHLHDAKQSWTEQGKVKITIIFIQIKSASSVSFFLADLQNQKTSLGSLGSLVSGAWSRFTSVLTATNLAPFAFLLLLLFQNVGQTMQGLPRQERLCSVEGNRTSWNGRDLQ